MKNTVRVDIVLRRANGAETGVIDVSFPDQPEMAWTDRIELPGCTSLDAAEIIAAAYLVGLAEVLNLAPPALTEIEMRPAPGGSEATGVFLFHMAGKHQKVTLPIYGPRTLHDAEVGLGRTLVELTETLMRSYRQRLQGLKGLSPELRALAQGHEMVHLGFEVCGLH